MFGGKKGVSLLYVLMALVCVGAMGSLVLNMAKKEKSDSSLRYSSELARYGSTSGLVLAINFDDANKAGDFTELMQKWYKFYENPTKYASERPTDQEKWLKLGADHNDPSKYYKDDNNNGMRYRAKIVNADFLQVRKIPEENGQLTGDLKSSYITIMVECESIDKSGSRAKNVGFYKIYGFQKNEKSEDPTSALYLGGGMDEINTPLTVNGNTFFRGSGVINLTEEGGNRHEFNGEFKLKAKPATSRTNQAGILKGSTFKGPAYFGVDEGENSVNLLFSATSNTFEGDFGLDEKLNIYMDGEVSSNLNFHANIYLKGKIVANNANKWKSNIYYNIISNETGTNANEDLKSKIYTTNNSIYAKGISAAGAAFANSVTKDSDINNMFSTEDKDKPVVQQPVNSINLLYNTLKGSYPNRKPIAPFDPPSIDIDLSKLDQEKILPLILQNNRNTQISGKDFNDEYLKRQNNGTLQNGWMLVDFIKGGSWEGKGGMDGFGLSADGDAFTGKMVLIVSTSSGSGTNIFKSANNSNCLIFVKDGVNVDQLGNDATFRGLIVKRGDKELTIRAPNTSMTINGAVYCVKGDNNSAGKFRLEGGTKRITINYDQSVLTQIRDELPGVIKVGDVDTEPELKTIDVMGISAEQVSRQF